MKKSDSKHSRVIEDVIRIDDVYGIVNHVQTNLKKCAFVAHKQDAVTIENILKDSGIKYDKSNIAAGVKITLHPPATTEVEDDLFIFNETYEDELPEDGQCF